MTVYSARLEADFVMPSSIRPDRRALHAVGCAFVSRLAPRAALTRTAGASGTDAPVFALKALSSLRPALSGLRFTIQILNLAGLTPILARACGSLARARLNAPLRAIGSARGSLSALCSLTPRRLRTCIRNRLLLARIRLRGRRLSTRLPACGGGLSVLRSLILCAVRLGLRAGLRARRIYRVPAAIFILSANRCRFSYKRCRLFRRKRRRFRSAPRSRCRSVRFHQQPARPRMCAHPRLYRVNRSNARSAPTCRPSLRPNYPTGCKHSIPDV